MTGSQGVLQKEAVAKAEVLEGELATCRGRLAGLGEGCSKCWHMLDDSKVNAQYFWAAVS